MYSPFIVLNGTPTFPNLFILCACNVGGQVCEGRPLYRDDQALSDISQDIHISECCQVNVSETPCLRQRAELPGVSQHSTLIADEITTQPLTSL